MQDDWHELQEEVKALREEQERMNERLKVVYQWLAYIEKSLPLHEKTPPPAKAGAPAEEAAPPAAPPSADSPRPSKRTPQELEAKIGGIWLNRIGIIIFLLGAAFFLKLAYDWGWINETARLALGAVVAAILLWLGERNRRRGFTAYGQGLTGGGIALLYFTIFASFYYYNLVSSTAGMGLLILVTVGAVALALYQNARAVAVIGLLTAFLNPVFFMAGEPRFVLLMVYLILLNLGLIAIVYFKRWHFVGIISFALTSLFLAGVPLYRFGNPALGLPALPTQLFLSIFLLLYVVPLLLHVTVRQRSLGPPGLFLMAAGAVIYYSLSWFNLHADYFDSIGWFTLGLAGFYLLAGFVLLPASQRDPRAYFTAFTLASTFLLLFVPLQLKDSWVLVGWTLQAVLLCYLGLRLADRRIRGGFWIVLSLALARLLSAEWTRPLAPENYRFLVNRTALLTFGFIAVLLLLGWLYHRFQEPGKPSREVIILGGTAGLLLLIFGSLEIHRFGSVLAWRTGARDYYYNMALMMVSLFWGVSAAALMAAGFIRKLPLLRYAAIGLLSLTVVKVLLFDLSFLEPAYRIISLVVSGLILLAVSYLYQRHRNRIDPAA
ncbi:MAG: DUF2339 domain-containing protein [Dethiobacteria bacterium]